MTIPSFLHVGQAEYTVKLRKQELFGETSRRHQRIYLSPKQGLTSMRDTLLHECLHALLHESGAAKLLDMEEDWEEKLVRLLTPWLLMLLRDNPDLTVYLVDDIYGDPEPPTPLRLLDRD